jgi:peptide/histidine transporter 3/4
MVQVRTRIPIVPAENDAKPSSFIKIAVLNFTSQLSKYSTWVMMAYLTGVWKMSITKAAATVNIWVGLAGVLPVALAFIADTFTGNYFMLFISTVSYSCGLGFLSMSTPPPLSSLTGNCREYEPECLGETQKGLFYASLALTAVGIGGHLVSFEPFLDENRSDFDKHRFSHSSTKKKYAWILVAVSATAMPIVGGLILPYITTWSIRFGIPAICTSAATILFLSGSLSYKRSGRPEGGSAMTAVYRVLLASAFNISRKYRENIDHLFEREQPYPPFSKLLPHSRGLSCLDKAAIMSPGTRVPGEGDKRNVRLCTVTEVEVSKGFVRIIPMWATFIVGGLIISVGNTFFLEQANHMDRRIWSFKIPLAFILAEYEFLKYCAATTYNEDPSIDRGIMGAMVCSVVSCIIAAVVEGKRLHAVRAHGLLDKPEERIPITVFWLTFQYFFLACAESWFQCSIVSFFKTAAPSSMRKYSKFFYKGVFGLGSVASVLYVYIVGKFKPGWFQDTLNRSRYDKYYWALAALGAVNFVLYLFVLCFYPDWDLKKDDEEEPDVERMIPNEDNAELTLFCF